MSEKGLTNISLKKINKSKVYQYIYRKKKTSKMQIILQHWHLWKSVKMENGIFLLQENQVQIHS